MLFVIGGLFVLFLIRMLLRARFFATIRPSPGAVGGSLSRTGHLVPPASLLSDRMESRGETGSGDDADDVLQYVPMGSKKEGPVDRKVDAPIGDDQLEEILTRIEGLQKKILYQLCLVSLLGIALIVCVGLYFYYKGEWF